MNSPFFKPDGAALMAAGAGLGAVVRRAQTIPQRKAILTAVDALLNFGGADAIADTLPRIELARKLLKEID